MNKRFNKALCEADDRRTKELVVGFLETYCHWKLNTPLDQQPEVFKDWDFLIETSQGETVAVEVEFVNTWLDRGRRPPNWPCLTVPLRKQASKAKYIFRVNHDLDTLAVTTMDRVRASRKDYKNTRNGRSGETTTQEPFFFVEFDQWLYATKFGTEGHWKQIDQFGNNVIKPSQTNS